MKKIILFLSLSFFIVMSCNDEVNKDTKNENLSSDNNLPENVEDKVIDAIESIPEYKEAADHVSTLTDGEQTLSSIIEVPDEAHSDYYIKVGYNQESWFETYYHFYVNPKTLEISIKDITKGDIIPLDEWRKREIER